MKRNIVFVTTSRADYGLLHYTLKEVQNSGLLNLLLIAAGMHLSPLHGYTVKEIEKDGFEVAARVEMLLASDSPEGISSSIGLGAMGFAKEYARLKPSAVVLFGDRFEMASAAIAAVPFNIPLIHIAGGESTEGLIDDKIRNMLTTLSEYHYVSLDEYKEVLVSRGVSRDRIEVVGYPAIENILRLDLFSDEYVRQIFNWEHHEKLFLITFHPLTLKYDENIYYVTELLKALESFNARMIFTAPNVDTKNSDILFRIKDFVSGKENRLFYESLGRKLYLSTLKSCDVVIGNSSSGIIETAPFGKPCVNVGNRQGGRIKGRNVIDVSYRATDIIEGINKAIYNPEFRKYLWADKEKFGDGRTSKRIAKSLEHLVRNGFL